MNWRPVVWSLVAGTFLSRIGTYMTMPFLAIYLHQVAGMEAGWVGTVIGVSFLVGMFSSFLGGVWSYRFGRYPIMLISLLGWSATFVGFAMVQTWRISERADWLLSDRASDRGWGASCWKRSAFPAACWSSPCSC